MGRRRKRKPAPPRPPRPKRQIRLYRVHDEASLGVLRYWLERLEFDAADAMISRAGEPAVDVRLGGETIAGVICCDQRAQQAAENICAAVLIRREDYPELCGR